MCLTQMAFSGSILILCILLIRTLALHRLPKTLFLILWEMAALRLLLPIAIPVPSGPLPLPTLHNTRAITTTVWPALSPDAIMSVDSASTGPHLPALIWGLGTAVFAIWFFYTYVKSRRVFQTSLPAQSPECAAWLAAHNIRRPLDLRESDQIGSPLTYGILHPVILLPKKIPPETLEMVLTHEYVHVRRFDSLAKLVFAAALCLHWWNPLVWGMYALADRDMELSCDAVTLRLLGGARRKDYAMTLLSLEERRSIKTPSCSYFSENLMKERIESIMKFQKTTATALVVGALLTVGAVTAFAAEKLAPADAAKEDTLPYGYKIDLNELQSMDMGDGTTLYALKDVDLEHVKDESDIQLVTYEVSENPDEFAENFSLADLPSEHVEHVEPTEAYLGKLVSVKHSDQSKFSPEAWAAILERIEAGEIVWED